MEEFRKYKETNNESLVLYAKSETDEAMRKVQEYQEAYSRITFQLEDERKNSQLKYEDYLTKLESVEQTWIDKTRRLEQIREEELQEVSKDYEDKHQQVRKEFEKKEKLLAEEMQAKVKTMLAEKDKKYTEKLIHLEQENEALRKELDNQRQLTSILEHNK